MELQLLAHRRYQNLVTGKFSIAEHTNALIIDRPPITEMIVRLENH